MPPLPVVERLYRWFVRRMHEAKVIDGVDVLCISLPVGVTATDIEEKVREAIQLIRHTRRGYGELVFSHRRLIVVDNVKEATARPLPRAYVSSFTGHESSSYQYLACQLVWAATYIWLYWDGRARGKPDVDRSAMIGAGHAAQVGSSSN